MRLLVVLLIISMLACPILITALYTYKAISFGMLVGIMVFYSLTSSGSIIAIWVSMLSYDNSNDSVQDIITYNPEASEYSTF